MNLASCNMDKPEIMEKIDNLIYLQTPEGVELTLSPAGLISRSLAWLIDLLIRVVILLALSTLFSFLGDFGSGLFLLTYFMIEWLYPVIFELWKDGSTPGKKSMGLMVVQDDGTPVGMSASILRNLLRSVDFLPFFYVLGLLSCTIRKDCKRIGDIVAGTLVIYRHSDKEHQQLPEGESMMPAVPLSMQEQKEIVAFAERYQKLSDERKQELSVILAPELIPNTENAVADTLAMARWIRGL